MRPSRELLSQKLDFNDDLNADNFLDLHKSGVNVGTFDESGKVITGGSYSLIKVSRLLGIEIV